MAADLLAIDLDALEEGLVQEAALGIVGLKVSGLDVVREVKRGVEHPKDGILLDLVTTEEFVYCPRPVICYEGLADPGWFKA